MCFFKKKNKPKPEYKGIPIGIQRGIRTGFILAYYCTNCYYGIYNDCLHKEDKRCPKCNALLNWDKMMEAEDLYD